MRQLPTTVYQLPFFVSIKANLKNNPLRLLIALLLLHWMMVSFNPAPGQFGRRYGQIWLMAVLQPFQSGLSWGTSGISGIWKNYFDLRGARAENETLRAEKAKLEADVIQAKEQAKLAEQFKQMSSPTFVPNTQKVMARVIARDSTQWFKTIIIDKGSFSGVQKNHPVVSVDGLVGRVISVAPNASQVLLLTDERHGAGAIVGQLTDSRLMGFVRGKGEYQIEMRIMSIENSTVPAGELIVTSGLDGLYPKGLVIGRVAQETKVTDSIPVTPAAMLSKLDAVSVLLTQPDPIHEEVTKLADEGMKSGSQKVRRNR